MTMGSAAHYRCSVTKHNKTWLVRVMSIYGDEMWNVGHAHCNSWESAMKVADVQVRSAERIIW